MARELSRPQRSGYRCFEDEFAAYKQGNAAIMRLYHDPEMIWAEGCAWNGVGRYLVWSDIPNNTQLRWMEEDGHVSTFRNPANNSNGNTFDLQGRQISCEHLTRTLARYEYDGTRSELANSYGGKSLNAPNDAVVHPSTGDIFFTDPGYGGLMDYEGRKAAKTDNWPQPYQKEAVYRFEVKTGKLVKLTDEIYKPNGLCFSPDYKKLYVADTGASHYDDAPRNIKVWDVVEETDLKNGKEYASMMMEMTDEDGNTEEKGGFADGIRCDEDGNIWASAGWVGDGYDGVHVFNPEGIGLALYCRKFVPMSAMVERSVIACLCVAAPRSMLSTLQPKVLISAKTGSVLQTEVTATSLRRMFRRRLFLLPGKKTLCGFASITRLFFGN